MTYTIIVLRRAQKEAQRLPKRDRRRVLEAVKSLMHDPFRGKQLHGEFAGMRAIRVWPYRILYVIDHHVVTVTVLRVGHRKDVYR